MPGRLRHGWSCWSVALSVVDLRTGRLPTPMELRLLLGLVALTLAGALVGAATFGGLLLAVPLGWFLGRSAAGWRDQVHGVTLALLVAVVVSENRPGLRDGRQ